MFFCEFLFFDNQQKTFIEYEIKLQSKLTAIKPYTSQL